MQKDLYEILGIQKGASEKDIKAAYRKLALKYHPDKNQGNKEAEKQFQEINAAYETLSDPQKKQQYDQFGAVPSNGGFPGGGGGGFGGFGGGGGFNGVNFSGDMGGFADIFESFFGGGGGGRSRKKKSDRGEKGNDIEATVTLAFEEAVFGVMKELEITKPGRCDRCGGKGAEPGTPIVNCKACGGTGEVRSVRNTILGQMVTARACSECEGLGKVPEKKCTTCHGTTRVRVKERVKVKIPAGVDSGTVIRVGGKGEAGVMGGEYGDLYVQIDVRDSHEFFRKGIDIYSDVKIPLTTAILGGSVPVKTVHGAVELKIPSGTQSGTQFKLAGKGIHREAGASRDGAGVGDHFVKAHVLIPKKLSKEDKELLI